jgi:predicted Zn-dependent protease
LWPKDFDSVDKVIEEIKNAHLYCDVYVYCAGQDDDEIKETLLDNLAYRIENGHIEPESIHDNMKKALLNEQPERFKEIFDEIFDEEAEADKDVNVMGDSDTEMTGIHTPKN